MRSLTYKNAPIVVPPFFTFKDLLNRNYDGYLWLLWNLVKLPVDDHPTDEHEEEDEAGRHPLELVVDRKVRVQVQHLVKSGQENSKYQAGTF